MNTANPYRPMLLRAAVALAERAEKTAWQARLFTDDRAEKLLGRSHLQSVRAMRLMRRAGV
jgi:hypothetical protein